MNQKISGVFLAGLLLVAGSAVAAPVSTNETASSPHPYQGTVNPSARDSRTGASGSVFPVSGNEIASSPHAFQGAVNPTATDGRTRAQGSVFPASASEVA